MSYGRSFYISLLWLYVASPVNCRMIIHNDVSSCQLLQSNRVWVTGRYSDAIVPTAVIPTTAGGIQISGSL